jgi:hypothetical protein
MRMYCATCGVVVAQGLNYCQHCGARLSGGEGDEVVKDNFTITSQVKPELLVFAMAGVFILGLVAITMLMGVMKSVLNLNVGQILAFTMLSFLIMLFLEGVLLRNGKSYDTKRY